ncbi:MAG TPA: flagellar hook protein FlgE [Methylomusa anaerophila]|uniref:Flagellar hook protein FlgE n=1 Tax=Methylomusa anaerophila TaxID=1930071 RepID=A0A348AH58_9FIRM|nr:flagellar hook protein FlgE [Methylomusa anaerophila]BBB90406.1 flagellar hook protein FlgE [Methylomusa anaerophila]HML90379.1 flagellar hook protein FlgE [Methylomusa anaerophila]
MMPSVYSAVAGLKAQSTKMGVIANNIANVSTTGYKQQTVSFSDLLSQTLSNATGSSASKGGTNPIQLGLGVNVASVNLDMTVGTAQSTGVATDASISGDGFFIVTGGPTGTYQFTRDGSFDMDEDGNLTVNGYKVCGWLDYDKLADGTYEYNTQKEVEAINLYSDSYNGNKEYIAPKATTTATLKGNLDPSETAAGTALDTIGTLGQEVSATSNSASISISAASGLTENSAYTITLTAGATTGNYDITVTDASGNTVATLTDEDLTDGATLTGSGGESITLASTASATAGTTTFTAAYDWPETTTVTAYDSQGNAYDLTINYTKCYTDTTTGQTSWYWEAASTANGVTPSSGYILFDSDGKIVTTDPTNYNTTPTLTLATEGTDITMSVDLTGISQTTQQDSDDNVVKVSASDGYAAGTLQSVSIGNDGVITGTYSNNQTQPLGMIALAVFNNPEGLEKIGGNLYVTTANSGDFTGGVAAGSNGTGSLSTGTLEMSNVDLSDQFSEMMITQRAYQANSKIITASDEMMKTLINMV